MIYVDVDSMNVQQNRHRSISDMRGELVRSALNTHGALLPNSSYDRSNLNMLKHRYECVHNWSLSTLK